MDEVTGRAYDTDVLIVGAGPVGLSSAIELARLGVRSIVVEKHESTTWHPKTRNINTRTMEIVRSWPGLAWSRMRSVDIADDWKTPIWWLDSIVGETHASIETPAFVGVGDDLSPARPIMSSQDLVERVLHEEAVRTGLVDVRLSTRVVDIIEGHRDGDQAAVLAVHDEPSGTGYRLTGRALVGADGVDSFVRNTMGVELQGTRNFAHLINCYFRCDIEPYVGDRKGVLHYINNDRARGVLQALDGRGRWLCQIAVREARWDESLFDAERCTAWIRAAVGVGHLEPEILSVGKWRMSACIADEFVRGRTVLVGDASQQLPPTGGLGMNTGVQGAHNAMWKVALVIRGQADEALLDTYRVERQPISRTVAEQTMENHAQVRRIGELAIGRGGEPMSPEEISVAARRYGNHLGLELGSVYRSAAVVEDGSAAPPVADPYSDYVPSATPGARAPHVWIGRNRTVSTLDLVGPTFTLVTGGADRSAWANRIAAVGLPIRQYDIGAAGLEDDDARFAHLYGIDGDGAVLIRPDGHVAWRAASGCGLGGDAVADVVARLAGRAG